MGEVLEGLKVAFVESDIFSIDTSLNVLDDFRRKIIDFYSIKTELFDVFDVPVVLNPVFYPFSQRRKHENNAKFKFYKLSNKIPFSIIYFYTHLPLSIH